MAKTLKILLLESYRKFLKEDVSPDVVLRFKNLPNDELCNLLVTNRIDQDIFNALFADFINSKYYANDEDGAEKRDMLAMELIASRYATPEQLKAFIDTARIHKADKFRLKEATIKYRAKLSNINLGTRIVGQQEEITNDIKELEFIPPDCLNLLIAQEKLTKKEFLQFFNLFMTSKFYNTVTNGEHFRNGIALQIINSNIMDQNNEDKALFKALLRKFYSAKFNKIHQCSKIVLRDARAREHSI